MSLLLDTHALLWLLANSSKLSSAAKAAILDPANVRWLSPISLLEIAIKNRLGKLSLPAPFSAIFPALLVRNDIHLVPLEIVHIEPLTSLPMYHKDPFDRLIAATAIIEGLTVVSADPLFDSYGLVRLW
jgi:PIN domain nuclease of toxin-antitoxin system